jgi:hypothetical protein
MAQTKRKRRTKHRGNAAGMIETRGRTGSKPAGDRPKPAGGKPGRGGGAVRTDRWDAPPTWRGAVNRATIATVIFVGLVVLLFKEPVQVGLGLGAFMMLLYIPLGFYTDQALYKRRLRQKSRPGS